MRIVDPIISELEREAETTKRVLERVPNDKLNWKPLYTGAVLVAATTLTAGIGLIR